MHDEDDPDYLERRRCCVPQCNTAIRDDSTIPTCAPCGWEIAQTFKLRITSEDARTREADRAARVERTRVARGDGNGGQVYYVRSGEWIKIGFTTRLRSRMSELRARPGDLLAVEPGGPELERERHRQFTAERVSKRREDFSRSERLEAHMEELKRQHAIPSWSSAPSDAITFKTRA